jgi:type II secretory ATPase GspE/PulE/Tfp pilus assembly ATPase PilB-like protein
MVTLDKLGFSANNLKIFESLINAPNGIILVTGPTGSGKSTTLYSALIKINSPEIKIITIEDPIEYQMEGIRQSQINTKAGFTFASGLRSILRHDPDVIMVGEIRDTETAEISVQAALTGHLVFSTLHTNDAPSAVTRLIDMGVEPFLIASSVLGVMAQRLVRVICEKCKESYDPPHNVLESLNLPKGTKFYGGKGCNHCLNTGYSGRTMLSEIMTMTNSIRELILKRASSDQIKEVACKEGMILMRQDGINKVIEGQTTIEEVMRVA